MNKSVPLNTFNWQIMKFVGEIKSHEEKDRKVRCDMKQNLWTPDG